MFLYRQDTRQKLIFENVAGLKYLGATVKSQNFFHEEVKSRVKCRNICSRIVCSPMKFDLSPYRNRFRLHAKEMLKGLLEFKTGKCDRRWRELENLPFYHICPIYIPKDVGYEVRNMYRRSGKGVQQINRKI
jgi:hypothetical protein